jgi:hypothetical protein
MILLKVNKGTANHLTNPTAQSFFDKQRARAMRDEGMTLQQIADALGYRSRSSVSRILNE